MSDQFIINAELRADVGKGASRRLRRTDKVPAVLYGGDSEPVALTLSHKDMLHDSGRESFYSSILEVHLPDGRNQQVVVRDLQRHPFKPRILHMDFMRVSATELLRISVPLHFTGEDESPAGKMSGVVIQHLMTEVEIEALPKDLPEYIEVDLSMLDAGEAFMLSDLKAPEGVELMLLSHDDDLEYMVANAIHISETQGEGVEEEEVEDDGEGEGEELEGDEAAEGEEDEQPEGDSRD
jgi:large subunit ribosomal protein L25